MIISAYVAENTFSELRPGDAERLTHINFAFAVVKNGRGSVGHWKNSEAVREFTRNKGHLKIILSVGGWGAGGFSPAVATAESREIFAQSLVAIADDYGFDGIDMDWEYPCDDVAGIEASPDDKVNYTLFMELMRQKLGPDKILSMAAGGMQSCVDSLELDKLMAVMDFINLMTYDMCPWDKVGYHTSLHPSDACDVRNGDMVVKMYEAAGVERSRITLGAAFYARVYRDVDGLNAVGSVPGFTEGYKNSLELAEAAGGVCYDSKAEAAYAYNEKEKTFLTFENPRTLKAKMNYVKSTNLAGIMFWEYSHDTDESILLKNIADALMIT